MTSANLPVPPGFVTSDAYLDAIEWSCARSRLQAFAAEVDADDPDSLAVTAEAAR